MTRIAILETGAPPPAMAAAHGDYPAMFRDLLGEAFDFETFDVQAGQWPEAGDFDAAIITGSAAGVYEDAPWIGDLLDWIRAAKGRTRLVGVCFGHQAMAQALGGRVEKSERGWGVGLHRYQVESVEPWMTPAAAAVAIPASHQDQVVEKPADARVLLRSDFTPFAGLAWGEDAISFQAHPEFTPAFATDLTAGRHDRIDPALVARAVDSLKAPDDRAMVGGWIRAFIGA
ncbi:MAG: type 1 glutamine amidotransferase [Alphaproteobacteria bacterium]|jgi:GMP synthase-like glutamine amidotransferase|nr:type 1 glutamine amidotransferase [Alphaproteobacteria bacterium]MBU2041766.1 type 1 glutamine amidotransferase [Alphaproteobacteria bacterium]MBU2126937.1 type 1 glutamine amidotransferase [Alphaproteobacteria bacterium]MBU2208373.1 type 1 glutamine amidotransferase [Alphaproteobacteria bacterium]MBU2290998.1 type 1 glutamine amidotransferase [Alphaproteobacteria bacterium]